MRYVVDLKKAPSAEVEEGLLSTGGKRVARRYAQAWLNGSRDLELERKYPELSGLFYDLRIDSDLSRLYATE